VEGLNVTPIQYEEEQDEASGRSQQRGPRTHKQPTQPSLISGLLPVAPNNSLWRYISIPVLFLYLQGRIRLSSVQELRRLDPQEGVQQWDDVTQTDAFSPVEYAELRDYIKSTMSPQELKLFEANQAHPKANQEEIFRRWHKILIATRYGLCFFESPHESVAMWNGYALNGVAIRTSMNSLETALKDTNRPWRISKMLYWDKSREITPDDTHYDPVLKEILRHPYLVKGKEYEYEKEIRLCTVDPARRRHLIVQRVPPESWIQEIRISPKIWHQDAEVLINLIAESCPQLKAPVSISPLTPRPSVVDEFEEQLDADVSKDEAENWPAFLHKP